MKRDLVALTCLIIIVFVFWAERDRWMPAQVVYVPATPPARRLSPEGTFVIVQYVAARTQRGIAGFEPGMEVKLVSVNKNQRTLCVTDGKYQADVSPMQITNDLEVAAVAQRPDQASQCQLQDMLESARQQYDKSAAQAKMLEAKEMAQVLDRKANDHPADGGYLPTYYGSPYYYLALEPDGVVARK
jgi:hypothetical protein